MGAHRGGFLLSIGCIGIEILKFSYQLFRSLRFPTFNGRTSFSWHTLQLCNFWGFQSERWCLTDFVDPKANSFKLAKDAIGPVPTLLAHWIERFEVFCTNVSRPRLCLSTRSTLVKVAAVPMVLFLTVNISSCTFSGTLSRFSSRSFLSWPLGTWKETDESG